MKDKVYLITDYEGEVIDVIKSTDFETAYKNTIGRNYGEFLVEIDEKTIKKIEKLFGKR